MYFRACRREASGERFIPSAPSHLVVLQELHLQYNPLRKLIYNTPEIIFVKHNSSSFKWQHFEPTIILLCVCWYCRYQLSYRDLKVMVRERGLTVDHTTIWRWVQRYAPEINKRIRPNLKMSGTSYRVDETYIKVVKSCKYLYRAVDKKGKPLSSYSQRKAMFARQNASLRR